MEIAAIAYMGGAIVGGIFVLVGSVAVVATTLADWIHNRG